MSGLKRECEAYDFALPLFRIKMHKGIHPKLMKAPKLPRIPKPKFSHASGMRMPRLKVTRNLEPKD
jgi:hypothetical protein